MMTTNLFCMPCQIARKVVLFTPPGLSCLSETVTLTTLLEPRLRCRLSTPETLVKPKQLPARILQVLLDFFTVRILLSSSFASFFVLALSSSVFHRRLFILFCIPQSLTVFELFLVSVHAGRCFVTSVSSELLRKTRRRMKRISYSHSGRFLSRMAVLGLTRQGGPRLLLVTVRGTTCAGGVAQPPPSFQQEQSCQLSLLREYAG